MWLIPLAALVASAAPAGPPPPSGSKLAVVLFNFKNDDRQPIAVEEVRRRIFTDPDSTRAFYREQSYGLVDLVAGPQGDVFGWYTLDAFNRPCDRTAWASMSRAAAGVDLEGYDHLALFFPPTDACPFLGYGEQPGKTTWTNGTSIAAFTHELGHNVGTPHASARICTGPDGQRVTLSGSCTDLEYGNPFDVMGAGLHHTNGYNKALAHWLARESIQEVQADGEYTLVPQERPSDGVKLLSIRRDESTFYYLEYRQPFGFDDFAPGTPATTGVMVLVAPSLRDGGNSFLLDMTPGTASLADAPLGVGLSYRDPTAGVEMTVLDVSPEAARVRVAFGTGQGGCQSVPGRSGGAPIIVLLLAGLGLGRKAVRRGGGPLLAWLALAGCSAKTSSAGPDGGPPPAAQISLYTVPPDVEQVCQAHAQMFCARLAECAPHRLKVRYATIEMCQARRDQACRVDFLTPGRNEQPSDRMACIQALAAQSCRDIGFDRRLPACDEPPGLLPTGEHCSRSSQCAPGLACHLELGACGRCQPELAAGADCGWWAAGCPAGTGCFGDQCLPLLELGEPCKMTPAQCETGTQCTARGCVDKFAEKGTPCLDDDLCDPARNLHCNLVTGTCEFWAPSVAVGASCGTVIPDGSVLTCTDDAICFGPSARICIAMGRAGDSCDLARGKDCQAPATCTGGQCVVPAIVSGVTYAPSVCR